MSASTDLNVLNGFKFGVGLTLGSMVIFIAMGTLGVIIVRSQISGGGQMQKKLAAPSHRQMDITKLPPWKKVAK